MSNNSERVQERIFALDLLKAISIIAVVSFHGVLVPQQSYVDLVSTLNILFAPLRFCVPVFLTISFFLCENSLQKQAKNSLPFWLKKRLTRLALPTVFWFLLAALLVLIKEIIIANPLTETLEEIIQLVLKGRIFAGAYYLLVIFQLSLLFIYLNPYFKRGRNLVIAILLQGLVFVAIDFSLQGNWGIQFSSFLRVVERPFLIYWFVYLGLGVYFYANWEVLSQISSRIQTPIKILLLVATSGIMMAETNWLEWQSSQQILPFEYAMLSCMLSVFTIFFSAASVEENQVAPWVSEGVHLLSKYSLGIFCINGILFHIFITFSGFILPKLTYNLPEIIVIKLLGTIFLISISLGLSMILDSRGFGIYVS
ncbi:acyltransferase family protein [Crocosphaera sp.]|uniref:acyltransferase family protein n=1 Tax=Crocosphaera sp. TaxID=2729996 RepID=UPI003F2844B7|nr:acyltransferase [Crocosphaera sp.]